VEQHSTVLIDSSAGQTERSAILEQQVRRMLKDQRAGNQNFTGQWLGVRSLASSEPVVNMFPDTTTTCGTPLKRRSCSSAASFTKIAAFSTLTADYTYVNERLAKHYGIPNIYGPQFRRVTLTPDLDMRRGLLGKGALLTVTSNAARTSPVTRGKWFQQTFLGVSPPDPPPNVPAIKEKAPDSTGNAKTPTMRQTMEAHHTNPSCNTCHQIFEPIGLAMENFDATGAWRTQDEGLPIDASGVWMERKWMASQAYANHWSADPINLSASSPKSC
jgi:hypothetical protein